MVSNSMTKKLHDEKTSNSMTSELTILVTKTLFEGQRRALEPRSSLTPDLAAR